MVRSDHITVLGGGPAGLATGYFANKMGMPFTIYEAKPQPGGNAITIQHGEFRFDTGAHRFHDKDPEITREIKELLGDQLIEIDLPSHVYYRGKFIEFPLSSRGLVKSLGWPILLGGAADLVVSRFLSKSTGDNFERAAIEMYGRTISKLFLLNYSEKLWGVPCHRLSVAVSGNRLSGLNPLVLIREMMLGPGTSASHMEGRFYYPKTGYGAIVEALASSCGLENIHLDSPIEKIHHSNSRIESISVKSQAAIPVTQVVNTLPLPLFLHLLDPAPPEEYRTLAQGLRFRNLVVVAIFLDLDHVTNSASVYFPDKEFAFTRIYEPIHRSRLMAPPGKTSLCFEYPCFSTDSIWQSKDQDLIRMTIGYLEQLGLASQARVIGSEVIRMSHAYPVLEAGIEDKITKVLGYLANFSNLSMVGRNGRFVYAHVHDMLRFGLDVTNQLAAEMGVAKQSTGLHVSADGSKGTDGS
jgi:protoporphyrinogen oxidase